MVIDVVMLKSISHKNAQVDQSQKKDFILPLCQADFGKLIGAAVPMVRSLSDS